MAGQARQTTDETYATPEKQWVTDAGPATDKQIANSQKWVDEKDPAAVRDAQLAALAGTSQIVAPGMEAGKIAEARAAVAAAPTAENKTQLDALVEKHQQLIAEKRADSSSFNTRFEESGTNKPGHPYGSGKEAFPVSADPQLAQEPIASIGAEGETRTVPAPPGEVNDWREAKINRGTERTIGVARAGPSDTELNRELQKLSPADQHTLDLLDPVYGPDSKANRIVNEAEAGLRKATDAVQVAENELAAAQKLLTEHAQALAVAIDKDPAAVQVKVLAGDALPLQRKAERAEAKVTTAEQVKAAAMETSDAEYKRMQEEVLAAKEAMKRARRQANEATLAFNQEVARLKASGELTPELIAFVGDKNLLAELNKAQEEVAAVLGNSGAIDKALTLQLKLFGRASLQGMNSAETARKVISEFIPEVRRTMGPRVASLVDTMLRLRIAHNILGEGNALKNTSDALRAAYPATEKTLQQKVQAAQKTLEKNNKRLTAHNVKVEILRIEAQAAREDLQKLQEQLAQAQSAPRAPETQAAQAQVTKSAEAVHQAAGKLSELKETSLERITSARLDVERAKETRKKLYENEAAVRAGKEAPIVLQTRSVRAMVADLFNKREVELRGVWGDIANQRAEATEPVMEQENHLADLRKAESALTDMWLSQSHSMVDIDRQIQTIIDTTAIMQPGEADPTLDNAQRVIDRAGYRADLLQNAKDEAALITEIDDGLKPLRIAVKDTIARIAAATNQATRNAETQHLNRLHAHMERIVAAKAERLQNIRDRKPEAEEAYGTAPEPDSVGYTLEALAQAKLARDKLNDQLAVITAGIESIKKERAAQIKAIEDRGAVSKAELNVLGLSDDTKQHAELRAKLAESLQQQREMEELNDKEVASALQFMEEELAKPTPDLSPPTEAYRVARKLYDDAVARRAHAYDTALQMMKDQLELIAQLPKNETKAKTTAKPARTHYVNIEGERIDTEAAPLENAPANEAAIGKTAEKLAVSDVSVGEDSRTDAQRAFEERVDGITDLRALAKELGGYQADLASIEDRISNATQPDQANPMLKMARDELKVAEDKLAEVYKVNSFGSSLPKADLARAIDKLQARVNEARTRLKNIQERVAPKEDTTLRLNKDISPEDSVRMQNDIQERLVEAQRRLKRVENEIKEKGKFDPALAREKSDATRALNTAEADWKKLTGVWWGKGARNIQALRAQQTMLEEKIAYLDARRADLRSGRGPSVDTIAGSQGKAGRRSPAMVPLRNAGDFVTGNNAPFEERNLGNGKTTPATTEGRQGRTGTRAQITETVIHKQETAQQVVAKANADTAAKTNLRVAMERAALERAADAAHAEYARVKERYDIINRTPGVSENAKNAVAALLNKAKTADAAAQKALKEGTKTAAIESQAEADEDQIGFYRAAEDGVGTRLNEGTVAALERGDTQEALKRAISATDNPVAKRILSKIQSLVGGVRTKIVAAIPGSPNAPGGINSDGTVILLARRIGLTEESLGHEVTHAVTLQQLQKPDSALTPDQRNAKAELQKLYEAYKNDAASKNEVAKESLIEFVAEALGSRKMQQELAAKPWVNAAHGWAAFKRWVLQLVGVKPTSGPMLDSVLDNAEKLFAAPVADKTTSATPAHLRAMVDTLAERHYAPKTSALDRITNNFGLRFEQSMVDMRAPIEKALKTGNQDSAAQTMYFLRKADARMSHVYSVLSTGALKRVKAAKGHFVIEGGHSASAVDLFEAIGKLKGTSTEQKMATADMYMKAIRAKRVGVSKMDLGTTTEAELNQLLKEVDSDPEQKAAMAEVRRVYNDYNRGMIEFLADSGAIPKALARELLKHGDYVPYYRVRGNIGEMMFDDEHPITVGDLRHQKYLQELKGDEGKFLPLNEAVTRNTTLLTDMAMRNIASKSIAYALQDIGKGKGPISKHTGKATNAMAIRMGYGEDSGANVIRFNQEPDPANPDDDGKRHIVIDTKNTTAEFIPSEMLAQSIEGMSVTLPSFLKGAGWFSDVLRSGITRSPMYALRQLVRDPLSATFTAGMNTGPLTAIAKSMAEFGRQMSGHSPTAAALIRKGVLHSQIFNGSPSDLAKMSMQIAGGDLGGIQTLFKYADKAAMAADSATRAKMYDDVIARGGSEMEAEMAAIEMMNFHKRGGSPGALYASRMIPFFNAQIQGLNVLVKAATGNASQAELLQIKQKFINRALGMAAFTVVYAAAMSDDDEYKNAKPRDRYGNFFVPLGNGTTIKVPIPFEVGVLFKAIPEAFVDYIRGNFNEEEYAAIRQMLISSIPGATSWGIPQAVKPIVEVATNHDFYTNSQIESAGMEKLTPEKRYTSGTTEMAKRLSESLQQQPVEAGKLSPVAIEKLVRGYLGGIPIAIAAMANEVFNTSGIAPPERKLSQFPVFGSMFQDINGGGATDAMYAKIKALNEAKASARKMEEEGDMKGVERLHKEVIDTLTGDVVGEAEKVLQELSKEEREIRLSDLSPPRKREELDRVETIRTQEMKRYLQIAREGAGA